MTNQIAVPRTRRSRGHVDPDAFLPLIRYATLAANSHNTQPWKFLLEPRRISILPDLGRRLPAVDPDDHHLFASLGCAAENLLQAAQTFGLWGYCSYDEGCSCVRIDLEPVTPSRSALFKAIPKRQCSRAEYDGTPLTSEELWQLEQSARGDGISLLWLTEDGQKEAVIEYVAAGNDAQFADPAWREELERWIRFDARQAERTRDGLHGPVMGSPEVPPWLGRLFLRFGFSAARQNRKDARHIRSSSAIAVLHSESDDPRHWVEAGRAYQRLALQATALGLRNAFINQPVEVAHLRPQFAAYLGIGDRRPDLVVRIGRGPQMPKTLRRPLREVLARPTDELMVAGAAL